ncbi:hypothetical protein [Pseudomonas azadiae]|uniref:Uncharacterized protein n=1 Tax=Pseudomonas azadiae TaxID=2843612 RepID=A0ABS6P0T9_9PSED|nr:hypothetical protein [Pseudomonas azadiae]MBV4454080.1 hypothetical protein [Pseudomonas azadiae]NMF43694.1 hypothetical protein [Pseudomonas sp. SWRI 103]
MSTNFTTWAASTTLPSLMARTIRSVFLAVNPWHEKSLENFAIGRARCVWGAAKGFKKLDDV